MMTTRNPKQEGSNVWDCKPQTGLCPMNCNQCFYNRPGAFYVDIDKPHMPSMNAGGNGIMGVNSGHDSNIEREACIAATDRYSERFFNTSIPKFDFPAPVVFTANAKEEEPAFCPNDLPPDADGLIAVPDNLMFVRLRVSATNWEHIDHAIIQWARWSIPVVLTFMAYYTGEPDVSDGVADAIGSPCYEWKKRHINSYWCPTPAFMAHVTARAKHIIGPLVTMCGTLDSHLCKDCRNCETYYYQTVKHMAEVSA